MQTNTNTEQSPVKVGWKTVKIISKHNSLSDAVKASGMDLSYNPRETESYIKRIESKGGGMAFVTEEGIFYHYECDISLLNKFEPFFGCISNSPFCVVWLNCDETEICFSNTKLRKCQETRVWAKQNNARLYSN